MTLTWLFYAFSAALVLSAIMVVTARNPVHSVLFLILCFFISAGIFVMLNSEFIAMIMVIVYVGAVAVLFLFVVMMLDISFSDLRKGAKKFIPVGGLIGAVILAELYIVYKSWSLDMTFQPDGQEKFHAVPLTGDKSGVSEGAGIEHKTNAEALGEVLYTQYVLAFQMAGMILFVAMVGAIVLTLRMRPDTKRQNVSEQVNRRREDVVEVKKVTTGTGV